LLIDNRSDKKNFVKTDFTDFRGSAFKGII